MAFGRLTFHHVTDMRSGFGFAYVQDPDTLKYHIVRVKFDTDGKPSLDMYVGEEFKEERDVKVRVSWYSSQ